MYLVAQLLVAAMCAVCPAQSSSAWLDAHPAINDETLTAGEHAVLGTSTSAAAVMIRRHGLSVHAALLRDGGSVVPIELRVMTALAWEDDLLPPRMPYRARFNVTQIVRSPNNWGPWATANPGLAQVYRALGNLHARVPPEARRIFIFDDAVVYMCELRTDALSQLASIRRVVIDRDPHGPAADMVVLEYQPDGAIDPSNLARLVRTMPIPVSPIIAIGHDPALEAVWLVVDGAGLHRAPATSPTNPVIAAFRSDSETLDRVSISFPPPLPGETVVHNEGSAVLQALRALTVLPRAEAAKLFARHPRFYALAH